MLYEDRDTFVIKRAVELVNEHKDDNFEVDQSPVLFAELIAVLLALSYLTPLARDNAQAIPLMAAHAAGTFDWESIKEIYAHIGEHADA